MHKKNIVVLISLKFSAYTIFSHMVFIGSHSINLINSSKYLVKNIYRHICLMSIRTKMLVLHTCSIKIHTNDKKIELHS